MTTNDEAARREMRDRQAARILESSVLIGTVARGLAQTARAARTSRVAGSVRRGLAAWHRLPGGERQFASGVLLAAAAITHLLLALVGKTPPGWMWMVPPAIVAAIGITLIVAASADQPRESS